MIVGLNEHPAAETRQFGSTPSGPTQRSSPAGVTEKQLPLELAVKVPSPWMLPAKFAAMVAGGSFGAPALSLRSCGSVP